MEAIRFIEAHGWDALTDQLAIDVKQTDDLFVLNYSQIDSPKMDPVVQECRGLVLDKRLKVVCRPFKRFLNYGEGDTKSFDFSDVTIYEKADGSLVKVYYNPHAKRWECATRGSAYGEVPHCFGTKTDWTFREAILDAMGFTEDEFQKCMMQASVGATYLFEYCSPFNRIVTPYDKPHVVLLAVVWNSDGTDESYEGLEEWHAWFSECDMNVRLPKTYVASSADEIVKLAESLDNLQEGFVVYDNKTGQRVKIKSSVYCAVHHLRGNGTPTKNALVELVLKNEQDELLAYFPEYKPLIEPVEKALDYMLSQAQGMYSIYSKLEDQKQFAMAVKQDDSAPILFKSRKEGISIREAFNGMMLSQQVKLLEKYL